MVFGKVSSLLMLSMKNKLGFLSKVVKGKGTDWYCAGLGTTEGEKNKTQICLINMFSELFKKSYLASYLKM